MDEYKEVREAIAWYLWNQRWPIGRPTEKYYRWAEDILGLPGIAVLSEDQKHPSSPWPSGCDLAAGFIRGTTIMWLDGFRRIVEKPEVEHE